MSESSSLYYLSNGMAVQLQSVADLSAAAVCLRVDAGSHHEPARWPGLAHLLEHLLFQGGMRFPGAQRLMPWVAARHGRVNATTEACRTLYYFDVRSDELSAGLARLLDMALSPEFSADAIRREIPVIDAEYGMLSRHTPTLINALLATGIGQPPAFRRFVAGNRQSLDGDLPALRQALLTFHQQYYSPGNLCLIIRAPLSLTDLSAALTEALSQAGLSGLLPLNACRTLPFPARAPVPVNERQIPVVLHVAGEGQHCLSYLLADPQSRLLAAVPLLQALLSDAAPGSFIDAGRRLGLCHHSAAEVVSAAPGYLWLLIRLTRPAGPPHPAGDLNRLFRHWLAQVCCLSPQQQAHYVRLARQDFLRLSPMEQVRKVASGEAGDTADITALAEALLSTSPCELQTEPSEGGQVTTARGFLCRWSPAPEISDVSPEPAPDFVFYPQTVRPAQARSLPEASLQGPADGPLCYRSEIPGAEAGIILRPVRGMTLTGAQLSQLRYRLHPWISRVRHAGGEASVALYQGVPQVRMMLPAAGEAAELIRLLCSLWPDLSASVMAEDTTQEILIRRLLAEFPQRLAVTQPTPVWSCIVRCQDDALFSLISHFLQQTLLLQQEQSILPPLKGEAHHLPERDGDNALLFFLPLDSELPAELAAARQLGAIYQPAFYQWLREELSAGYVVSCRFESFADRQGILCALQSPRYDCAQLAAWCRQFFGRVREQIMQMTEGGGLRAEAPASVLPADAMASELQSQMAGGHRPALHDRVSVRQLQQLHQWLEDAVARAEILSCGR
ncbi:pyrroloquinoline quinone biosynthesis protein PqqF [Tatumella ptyseos]|uniref:pyrroloquinoline quinone biosynthesis protein PqqF n=1 Tax=Tatumella ptyseos TaxID=82987 RepID=UPI0023F213E4|nr:pyrroloquinoline quinone biosynthesis protein PqqF [Tatumella ptyseos]